MEATTETSPVVPAQLLAASSILRQCLFVIKTAPEFQSLSYRVTKTRNDVEVLVVYREGILGIFGPPVDPITLTLDPKGRCLVTVLFKPVQRVSIVSPESGQIEIASLLAVLRMISGKGYLFCPGLPERFLAKKACGKFMVLHRVPFKRYQSAQCPVYYYAPSVQQTNTKISLCALCPKCMQAAKWIQSLPVIASNSSGIASQLPVVLPGGQPEPDQRNVIQNISTSATSITWANNSMIRTTVAPSSVSSFLPVTNFHNPVTSFPAEPGILKSILSSGQQVPCVDVNGNTQSTLTMMASNNVTDQNDEVKDEGVAPADVKIQMLRVFLKNMLHERHKKKLPSVSNAAIEIGDTKMSNGSTNRVSHDRPEKGKRYQKNICRHCKKQFSTPASLLNHLQRHEALSGTWQKKFREQRMRKRNHFSFLHRGICQRSKVLSFQHSEKHGYLPETSIKLFLKYLDDVVASQNGAKSLKQKSCTASHNKTESAKSLEKQNHAQMSQIASAAKIENEAFKPRSGLKRSTSGLSPMQTLLEAAAIAEVSQDDVSSPTVSSSSSLDKGKYQEAVVVSTTSQSPTFLSELSDDVSLPPKKQRKSTRLATKRARNNKKKTENVNSCTEAKVSENAAIVTSHDPTLLTNLNLLSTVSLETAMRQRQMPTTLQGQEPISSCIPLPVLSPEMKISTTVFPSSVSTTVFPSAVSTHLPVSGLNSFHITHPTSQSVNIPPQILHNTSGGNVKISRSQNMASFTNTSLHSNSSLPPLPPLVYAGMHGASTLSSYSPHKQDSSVPQSLSSMLKSPVDIKQLTASTSVVTSETEAPKNHSSNSNCGAIDLSKPKLAQVKTNIPEGSEKNMDITVLSGLPHSLAQLVTSNDKLSEVLQNLVLMGKTQSNSIPPFKEIQPIKASGNGRQADSDLQARMFASARNYKIDNKGVTNSPQVQAVIASSSRMAQLGKGMKPGSLAQAEEVQCGYKWSGSGGLVKERTQMVRELVSADIMASFLAKTQPPAAAPHQLNISVFNTSQPQQLSPQLVLNSVSGRPSLNISQDQSASEGALNLITTKAPEIAGSSKKGVAGRLQKATSGLSSSPPLSDWGSTFAGSVKKSILRSSLTNTQPQQKLQPKAINLSQTNSPLTSSVPSMPTPSSNCTISSPSLAAMLRQPAGTMHEPNHVSLLSSSPGAVVTSSLPAAQLSTVIDSSLLTHPRSFHIKVEPVDLYSPEQGTVIMALPLKTEKQDQVVEKMASEGDGSPKSLIVDINPD